MVLFIQNNNKDNGMQKVTFSMPEELFERMEKYLSRYGKTRGKMSIFIQDAIMEKLDRVQLKK